MATLSSEGGIQGASCTRGRDKILVTVRVRPLSSREGSQNDGCVWDCIDSKTIALRLLQPDRSPHPKCYTFDRVFGPESITQQVYEEGAKDIALSTLTGVNATIFAYGQTSSGKTFTMRGITENAIRDIYAYIEKHRDKNFILKVSALEIYNEVVKDMLNMDSGPLRLLDDPEKGTIVEKLVEDVVQDMNHLKQILLVAEAQRQVGETLLNDRSSRSHQIIRLTVESSPQGLSNGGCLVASLNFVDLAGSERASQTLSEGARLKEGCHINRSLLTLTNIIRKLSGQGKGKRGHLPYRDSKLTRILQNSLGGNARTAIICTMSPAQSHVEQSRNTLFFAMQAKEVVNTARVNLVVSDKALLKQLQKEVARLEAELRPEVVNPCPLDAEALLNEKNAEIQQLRAEMRELYLQRDRTQARLDGLLRKIDDEEAARGMEQESPLPCLHTLSPVIPKSCTKSTSFLPSPNKGGTPEKESSLCTWKNSPLGKQCARRLSATRQSTTASLMLVHEIRKLEHLQDELGEDAARALEALQKEVECLRLAQAGMNHDAATTIAKLQSEILNLPSLKASKVVEEGTLPTGGFFAGSVNASLREEMNRLQATGEADHNIADTTIATLEEQLDNVQKSLDNLVLNPKGQAEEASPMQARTPCRRKAPQTPLSMGSSNNKRAAPGLCSPRTRRVLAFEHNENNPPNTPRGSRVQGTQRQTPTPSQKKQDSEAGMSNKEGTPRHQKTNSVDLRKMQSMFKTAAEENIRSIRAYVTELKERVAKLQYQKQLLVCQVLELEANGSVVEDDDDIDRVCVDDATTLSPVAIPQDRMSQLQKQRMQIVKLWDVCQVSIIHRSQFFLLFKGEPADEVYMEVELRRLMWLQEHFSQTNHLNVESGCEDDDPSASLAASSRALKREREQFARRMRVRLTQEEREEIYQNWDVALDSKQRKLQVAHKIWTDVEDLAHIHESAQLVARVVGFWEPGRQAIKEMFGLTFAPPNSKQPWLLGWNSFLNNLTL